MATITLNDGTVIENNNLSVITDVLFVYVRHPELTMEELFLLFCDESKTVKITAEDDEKTEVYNGYTDLYFMNKDERQICFGLRKAN